MFLVVSVPFILKAKKVLMQSVWQNSSTIKKNTFS